MAGKKSGKFSKDGIETLAKDKPVVYVSQAGLIPYEVVREFEFNQSRA